MPKDPTIVSFTDEWLALVVHELRGLREDLADQRQPGSDPVPVKPKASKKTADVDGR